MYEYLLNEYILINLMRFSNTSKISTFPRETEHSTFLNEYGNRFQLTVMCKEHKRRTTFQIAKSVFFLFSFIFYLFKTENTIKQIYYFDSSFQILSIFSTSPLLNRDNM